MKLNYLPNKDKGLLNSLCMRFFFVSISLALGVFVGAHADNSQVNEKYCTSLSVKDQSYTDALKIIVGISEVNIWKNNLKKYKKNFIVNPKIDKTVFHDGRCFWEIALYEDAGNHLILWNTYQSSLKEKTVYRINISDPDDLILVK